jgi:integrating conjugative element protein (TIGR03752 family)
VNNTNNPDRHTLGWISDPYGIPCVTGERRSNAEQYLGTQALITAAGAGAASLIPTGKNPIAVVGNTNGGLGTVGISSDEALNRVLASGVQDMSQWVNKLYGQAFAAVYVEPGAAVAVHLEQPLQIDYDVKGRRVNHRLGGSHGSDLD